MKMRNLRLTLGFLVVAGSLHAQQGPSSPQRPGADGKPPATDGRVWGALVYAAASEEDLSGSELKPPEALEDLDERLAAAFDFEHFEILGEHTQEVFREYESWVVPSADLFLKVDSKGPAEDGIALHLQFWQQQQVLVKTDAVLRADSPLFIAGPKWREGRLLFVLLLLGGDGIAADEGKEKADS